MENNFKKIKNIGIFWEGEKLGGVDSYLANLINSKTFKEINLTIFTNKKNLGAERLLKNLKNKNIIIIYYNSINQFTSKNTLIKFLLIFLKPIFFVISIFQFYFLLRKFKFEVFMGQCGGYGDFRSEMAAMFAAKFLGYPIRTIVIHHACGRPIFWNTLLNLINNLLSKILTSVISVSKATRDSVFYKSNLLDRSSNLQDVIIYNGVYLNDKVSDNDKINKIIYKDLENTFLIGILSRIESYKGHIDLIKAFSKLSNDVKNKFKIYFIGDGEKDEIEACKEFISSMNLEKYFVFTGYIEEDSISIVSRLDLLVSVTRTFEGFGLSIAEAMSVGTPVLCTKVGAIPEYLNNENSTLIEPSKPKQIEDALKDFIANKKIWEKKAELGKEII